MNIIILCWIFKDLSTFEIRIKEIRPDITDVGSNLEEATYWKKNHQDLLLKLHVRFNLIYFIYNNS